MWNRSPLKGLNGLQSLLLVSIGLVSTLLAQEEVPPSETEAGQPPRFSVQTYSSLLELRILRPDGDIVRGLRLGDLVVTRGGKTLSTRYLEEREEVPVSLGILIDIGSEMDGENIRIAKQAAFDLIHLLEPRDEILLGVYASEVDFLSELSADRIQLVRALENVASGGRPGFFSRLSGAFASSGNTGYAIDECLLRLKQARYENKIILAFSASFGNTGAGTREHLALAGARFFAVTWKNRLGDAFNLWSDRFARGDVIDSTGGVAFAGKRIAQQLDRLRLTLKSFYLLAFDPGEPSQDDQDLAVQVRQHPEYLVHWVYRKAGNNPFF